MNPAIFAPPDAAGKAGGSLVGLDRDQLAAALAALGEPPFRARQLWQWIYHHGVTDFAAMSNLPKPLRAALAARHDLARLEIVQARESTDGTRKWLVRLADGHEIETVFIPEPERGTLCVSAQVGCTLSCRFCYTGTQRLVRNLSAAEIVGQVVLARDVLGDWPSPREDRRLTNIVMMGMGEPLYNFDNVAKALGIVMDGDGIAISRRRITLSTAGVVPMMRRCGAELGVKLAVSLHATTDTLRDRLVPLNRKYPLADLIAACRAYPGARNTRRITFEYVMLKDVNDGEADAKRLLRLVGGIPAKVNLIPFNPWPGAPFARSTDAAIARFAEIVNAGGLAAPVRAPRGEDILAACGQLKSLSQRAPRRRKVPATAGE